MILFTLGNEAGSINFRRTAAGYLRISVFCVIFCLVYSRFSHGVHSPYMTWLFGWPFVLGLIPGAFFERYRAVRAPGRLCFYIWNSGVAAITVSSLLRGILEIAGTASRYQEWLMKAGALMLAAGAVAYALKK